MGRTSSRIKKFWIPKPTSLLSVASPDTLEMAKFDKWFSIATSLLSLQSCLSKNLQLFGPHSEACALKRASWFSALNYSNIRKDLSKDKVMKTSNRLQEIFCWTSQCIRSVLQKALWGKSRFIHSVQLCYNRGFIVFTSSENGFLHLKIQPGIFCMLVKLKTYFRSFC